MKLIVLSLLSLPLIVGVADAYRGSCGGWVDDAQGNRICCERNERPECEHGVCKCVPEAHCESNTTKDCPKK